MSSTWNCSAGMVVPHSVKFMTDRAVIEVGAASAPLVPWFNAQPMPAPQLA